MEDATTSDLVQMLSLKHDFPSEWQLFVTGTAAPMEITLRKEHFPYLAQTRAIDIQAVELRSADNPGTPDNTSVTPDPVGDLPAGGSTIKIADNGILDRTSQVPVYLLIRYVIKDP